ncbi:MAG: 16S rRNA (guanine(527)-N(7))-methyltransferase RsmG [Pseudomonadota bacterium]|nr:16S rRNA (guanine(527)-N(7))-methyltransferase RsmG [Pseudomonadota bacterium]
MMEEEARAWFRRAHVPRETVERMEAFAAFLRAENAKQNLVSEVSLAEIWRRHLLDSAQLLRFAPAPDGRWIDLGTGAGFPGLVVAALHNGPVTLVEERRLRVDFLRRAAEILGVEVEIIGTRVERVPPRPFDVISARAFAPLPRLLDLGTRFSTTKTFWVLPKGKNAESELEGLDSSWQGDFRLEPSLTDPQAKIIVATGVHRKAKRKSR